MDGNQVIHGKHGKLWLDGDELAEVENASAVLSVNREDVQFAGKNFTDSKMVGVSGTGSFTIKKVNNRVAQRFVTELAAGRDPRFQLTMKLDDPGAGAPIRASMTNCWLTGDVPVLNFDVGSMVNETFNFGFAEEPIYD